jgi:CubicO group peptidase (beta-lactamase class C family)
MKKILGFSIYLWFNMPLLVAQKNLSSDILPHPEVNQERLDRVDQVIREYIKEYKIPGAVALVAKDGNLLIHSAYGLDDQDTGKKMDKNGIFRIASQTKALTSVGILMLMESGKLLLSDPVHKFIPTFKNMGVLKSFSETDSSYTTTPAKRAITIRDLLTHTSGLGYAGIGSPAMKAIYAKNNITAGVGEMNADMAATMLHLGELPLEYQPGERWNYGLNTDVLGHIIELVSGMTLEAFFQKMICGPLGMKDTWFNLPASIQSRLTIIYQRDSLGYFSKLTETNSPVSPNYPNLNKKYFSGGGGLVSTAKDYAIFLQMLLNKGSYLGKQILAPRTVEMMLSNHTGRLMGDTHFGLGFSIVTPANTDDIRNPGTFSWGGAFATTYWADPKENLVAVLMTQQLGAGPEWGELQNKFNVAIYQALK